MNRTAPRIIEQKCRTLVQNTSGGSVYAYRETGNYISWYDASDYIEKLNQQKLGGVSDWQMVIDANLNGAYNCIHAVLPYMRDRGDGLIINVSSWAGRHDSYVAGPAYGASKHALSSMTATILFRSTIRINSRKT